MADPFIDLDLTLDPGLLADTAVESLQAAIPNYVPNPGNMEVIQIDALAPMAAEQAAVAAVVPSAVFRTYGTKLVGIAYQPGAPATVVVNFTLSDTLGHTIAGGADMTIAGLAFYLENDVVVAAGSSTGTGLAVARDLGVANNGLSTPVYLVNSFDWVTAVTVTGTTSGGVDPEDDDAYQDRLAGVLALQAPRPITASDYATFVLSFSPTAGTDQQEVGRATAIDGYDPTAHSFTANTSNGSPNLASVSSFTGVTAGTALSGTGIPANTTVVSVNTGASTLVMSANATATNSGTTVTATGSYGNSRTVSVFVTDANGVALNSDTLTAAATWLATYREANFLIYVLSPTYTTVYVTASVHLLPGFDPTATAAAVQAALLTYLSPAQSGNRQTGGATSDWLNDTVVRYNRLVNVIESVPGVDYVPAGSSGLAIGFTASPSATTDLTLPGPAPLPTSTGTTIPAPTVV